MATVNSFTWPVRVYYEDTDAGGVVYHSQYLNFMERARTEWLRYLGFEQTQLNVEFGVIFVVHSMEINFKKPAFFNDLLEIRSQISHIGFSSLAFLQSIYRQDQLLVSANVKVACVSSPHFKPTKVPAIVHEQFESSLINVR